MTSWANAGQNIANTASGVYQLPFNHTYRSIENLYLLSAGTDSSKSLNTNLDSYDITSANGSIQFTVGTNMYPLLPINTAVNKPAALMYLRECIGSVNDWRNSGSINGVEFSYKGSDGVTTLTEPAKFYVGVPLSKIQNANPYVQSSLLSGVDASSTPIIANVNIGTATAQAFNVYLVAEYTCLVEIDTMTTQVQVVN